MQSLIRRANHRAVALSSLLVLLLPSPASAVDGIVINTHDGADSLQYYGTIDGALWRHDIVNDQVTSYEIYVGPASRPVISPDGTRIAFVQATGGATGDIMLADIDGGNVTVLESALRNSLIDFPHADWVYFTMGGFHESTSGLLKRVNVNSGVVETVMQVKGRDGNNSRIAQIQISNDLARAVVRTGDSESDPDGEIVALDLSSDDTLDHTIGTRYSCAGGFFADGMHAMDGNSAHDGYDIRLYDDASSVKSFLNSAAFGWPPNSGAGSPSDLNHAIFNVGAATNSDRWMMVVTGGARDYKWDHMMLFNWKDERCIFVTEGLSGVWDHGDFWEGTPGVGPGDTTAPTIVSVATTSGVNNEVRISFSESVTAATAEVTSNYAIDGGISVSAAALSGTTVTLGTSALTNGSYTLTVDGISDNAGNAIAANTQVGFTYDEQQQVNSAPSVSAGNDQIGFVGGMTTLVGVVSDDGLPAPANLTTVWQVVSGDSTAVQIGDAANPITSVAFTQAGSFGLRLTADDGALQASDELIVTVSPEQSITLLSPTGGEEWPAGSTQQIEWSTVSVDDVMILFSPDNGQSWQTLTPTVDTSSSEWGSFTWQLPDTPTDAALIRVDAYLGGTVEPPTSGVFSIIASGSGTTDTGAPGSEEEGIVVVSGGLACSSSGQCGSLALGTLALLVVRRRRRRAR